MKKKKVQLNQKLSLQKTAIAALTNERQEQLKGGVSVRTMCTDDTILITVCIDNTSPGPDYPCELYQC
ncbi:MAG TPA: class I lanthipeptide [Chitinophaga sp.]|uniref:class I lanthipeptide n=1 Tax=Chitinophaga sp. TaxID=1869181 RepID=UPI002B694F45|nr:class I lanthipeptide [Chitinophaga sp.]HVI43419.1 class I lanthipeptide [Chitinophaga sp.]